MCGQGHTTVPGHSNASASAAAIGLMPVTCLDIQRAQHGDSSLAAVGYACGLLRISRVGSLAAAGATALAAASDQGVPVGSGTPPAASPAPGTSWQLDTGEQLRCAVWLRTSGCDGEGVLVTSGPGGVVRRHFAEVRLRPTNARHTAHSAQRRCVTQQGALVQGHLGS